MLIECSRNTGFYGMGSPLELRKNNDHWVYLTHNQTKTMEIKESESVLQVRFFLLKSRPYLVKDTGRLVRLEIQMNPQVVFIYLLLFAAFLVVPLFRVSIIGAFFLLLCFLVFLVTFMNKAYIIKEKF
ncbi:hypothetical protein GIX45_10145 [Erwinia sp. CPCC 100877]|nr:hypothetical protein [Erwinia sp. CPCC 100877]